MGVSCVLWTVFWQAIVLETVSALTTACDTYNNQNVLGNGDCLQCTSLLTPSTPSPTDSLSIRDDRLGTLYTLRLPVEPLDPALAKSGTSCHWCPETGQCGLPNPRDPNGRTASCDELSTASGPWIGQADCSSAATLARAQTYQESSATGSTTATAVPTLTPAVTPAAAPSPSTLVNHPTSTTTTSPPVSTQGSLLEEQVFVKTNKRQDYLPRFETIGNGHNSAVGRSDSEGVAALQSRQQFHQALLQTYVSSPSPDQISQDMMASLIHTKASDNDDGELALRHSRHRRVEKEQRTLSPGKPRIVSFETVTRNVAPVKETEPVLAEITEVDEADERPWRYRGPATIHTIHTKK